MAALNETSRTTAISSDSVVIVTFFNTLKPYPIATDRRALGHIGEIVAYIASQTSRGKITTLAV